MTTSRPGCLGILFSLFGRGGPKETAPAPLPYRLRDDFLSAAERSFYGVLISVVQDRYVVCPKVNLADIVFVVRPNENVAARNRIDRKHVDFVLFEASTMRPMLAIELDDASHRRSDRQERDTFVDEVFRAAGLPLVRVPAKAAYTTADIAERLELGQAPPESAAPLPTARAADAPICPKCGIPLVLRTAGSGPNRGRQFYGCVNYPRCRETAAVP